MITHEEDCDKANIVLTLDNQRGLQALFDYIIYLGIKVKKKTFLKIKKSNSIYFSFSPMKFYHIFFNPIVSILIPVCQQLVHIY
jgi:hypothetical protein